MLWPYHLHETPPGSWQYPGFENNSDPRTLAKSVGDFRKGNQLPRATLQECFEDVVVWNCNRLVAAGEKGICYETDSTIAPITVSSGGCSGCGIQV